MQGAAKKFNTNKIQTFQSTSLRMITCGPHYVTNHNLHSDLIIHTIQEAANISYKVFHARLANHSNPLILALYSESIP